MIAPALAPATFFHVLIGLVSCSAKPHSAPASSRPLTPPPRKTPSASSTQSNGLHSPLHAAAGARGHAVSRNDRGGDGRLVLFVTRVLAPRRRHCNASLLR